MSGIVYIANKVLMAHTHTHMLDMDIMSSQSI